MIAYGFWESYEHGAGSPVILLVPLVILILLSFPWRRKKKDSPPKPKDEMIE
jgi:hypothetical protein